MKSTWWYLLCQPGETVTARIERAKLEEGDFPPDATKGPLRQDRFYSYPQPADRQVYGEVRANKTDVYFILKT